MLGEAEAMLTNKYNKAEILLTESNFPLIFSVNFHYPVFLGLGYTLGSPGELKNSRATP